MTLPDTVPPAPQPQAAPQALPAVAPPAGASRTEFDDKPLYEQDAAIAKEPTPLAPISFDEVEQAIALLRPMTRPAPKPTDKQPAAAVDEVRPATKAQPDVVARAVMQELPGAEDLSDTAPMPAFVELPDMLQLVDKAQVDETQSRGEPTPHIAPRTMPQPDAAPRRQLLAVGAPDQPPYDKPQVAAMLAKLRGRSSQFEQLQGTRDALDRLRARLKPA
jgi:hypothetical protein